MSITVNNANKDILYSIHHFPDLSHQRGKVTMVLSRNNLIRDELIRYPIKKGVKSASKSLGSGSNKLIKHRGAQQDGLS